MHKIMKRCTRRQFSVAFPNGLLTHIGGNAVMSLAIYITLIKLLKFLNVPGKSLQK